MIVAVASGKGGTGKTTVATILALALKDTLPVQVLDCDVEAPNAHLFLNPKLNRREQVAVSVPLVDQEDCINCGECAKIYMYHAIAVVSDKVLTFPDLCYGCGGCTMVCPSKAITKAQREIGIIEYGTSADLAFVHGKLNVSTPLSPPVIKAVKAAATDGAVIIDAPPGTSCPVVTAVEGVDYCLLVTEPTRFGLNDLALAVSMIRTLGIPFGVIVNRAHDLSSEIDRYCHREGIPILLTIPFDRRFAEIYAGGNCLVEQEPEWADHFRHLWHDIEERAEHARDLSNQR